MNKPDTTAAGDMTIDSCESGMAPVAFLLKSGIAMKLGKQAVGGICYEILTDRERTEPMIKITANKGGYFSKEVLPFQKVEACIDKQKTDQAFPSKIFQAAFTGRSTNNGGFLAAILRAEAQHKSHEIADLVRWLMATPGTYIFGGLIRHIISPTVHTEFGDIEFT